MERVERMSPARTLFAKELNCQAVDTAILAIPRAALALAIGEDSPGFEPGKFLQERPAFSPPRHQRIILIQG